MEKMFSSQQQQPKKPQTTTQTENTNPKTTAHKTCAHNHLQQLTKKKTSHKHLKQSNPIGKEY
jgi:hypothetical protein